MQLSAAIFNDPTQRANLQKYYENKKSELINTLKTREADPSFEANISGEIKMPDGTTRAVSGNLMTAEMAEKSLVSFDKWLETTKMIYESQERMYEMAKKSLDFMEANNPDSPSGVHSTFSKDGTLLAYINNDGTMALSNGSDKYLLHLTEKANEQGLTGKARADYLHREVQAELSKHFKDIDVATYNDQTSPTKREFANMWYKDFNIDQAHNDAMMAAQAHYNDAKAWHDQMQKNMKEMQAFLLSLQEEGAAIAKKQNNTTSTPFEESESPVTTSPIGEKTAADEFLDFMNMSKEERYLALLLGEKDMTKEQFDALPPKEKEKILAEIQERIREDIEKKTGIAPSTSAIAA
jgi:hypothetical protein